MISLPIGMTSLFNLWFWFWKLVRTHKNDTVILFILPPTLCTYYLDKCPAWFHLYGLSLSVKNAKQVTITTWKILAHSGIRTHNPQITKQASDQLITQELLKMRFLKVNANAIPVLHTYICELPQVVYQAAFFFFFFWFFFFFFGGGGVAMFLLTTIKHL